MAALILGKQCVYIYIGEVNIMHHKTGNENPDLKVYSFFNLDISCCVWSTARPAAVLPTNKPGTHCIGGWMSPYRPSGGVRRISQTPGLEPQMIQPVAQSLY